MLFPFFSREIHEDFVTGPTRFVVPAFGALWPSADIIFTAGGGRLPSSVPEFVISWRFGSFHGSCVRRRGRMDVVGVEWGGWGGWGASSGVAVRGVNKADVPPEFDASQGGLSP